MALALFTSGCNAQDKKLSGEDLSKKDRKEMANQPDISWDVHKQFDEHGNVIGYDSTYTWSYTNIEGDSVRVNTDSLMNSFNLYFKDNLPYIWDRNFTQPLWADSLFNRDFMDESYFHNRWKKQYFDMDNMFREMDSIRMQFFNERYPGLLVQPPPKKNN